MKTAKIIITEQPIPFTANGSWNQRIEYFLQSKHNNIDYFICGETNQDFSTKTTFFKVKQYKNKFLEKLYPKYRYKEYTNQLHKLSNKYDNLIICVIDNLKLQNQVSEFINQQPTKNNYKLLFYNCGFSYFLNNNEHQNFIKNIDEIIFLTQSAYQFNKNNYLEFTPEVTVLNNPINKHEFFPMDKLDKEILLKKHHLQNKIVYLWLSHDRKKKGLDIVLNAWNDFYNENKNVVLLVVGAMRNIKISGVRFIGKVENSHVKEYYNLSHIYLFPTLWQEGFGLSLAQAICCGCFCIAANNGGVSDFFNSENGILISDPNIVSSWAESFELSRQKIQSGYENTTAGVQIIDYDKWSEKFAQIFDKWNNRLIN